MYAWLLLYVYVLGDVLDFVIVLFRSGVFEYIIVYSGWGGGACCAYLQNVLMNAEKLLWGAKNVVARDVWEFQSSPSRLLSSMVKCIFILGDKHAKPTLTTMGWYQNTLTLSLLFIV